MYWMMDYEFDGLPPILQLLRFKRCLFLLKFLNPSFRNTFAFYRFNFSLQKLCLNAHQSCSDFIQNLNSVCMLLQNRGLICKNRGLIFFETNFLEWQQNRAPKPLNRGTISKMHCPYQQI